MWGARARGKDAKRKFRSLSAFCKKFLWVLVLFSAGGILTGWGVGVRSGDTVKRGGG